jgi:hypothetical protein
VGYYLGDRARARDLDDYAALVEFLRAHDPRAPYYLELLPCDAWVGPALANADYGDYVDRFVRLLAPPLLSFGHHPLRAGTTSPSYFENLELVRRAALARGLPFVAVARAAHWAGMAPLTEGDLRWLVYTSLADGAKGLVWATWWGAPAGGREGIVEPDGSPTDRLVWVTRLNRELAVLGKALLPLRSTAVYHTGDVPTGATRMPIHDLIGAIEGGAFVVGVFGDAEGRTYLLVVSNARERQIVAKLTLNRPQIAVRWLDVSRGTWERAQTRGGRFQTVLEFPLLSGDGRLLRLNARD